MRRRVTPRRAVRALKLALTRTARHLQSRWATQPEANPPKAKQPERHASYGRCKVQHNYSPLIVHLLGQLLEIHQHIAPMYDLREGDQEGVPHTRSYPVTSSTTSLLAKSSSAAISEFGPDAESIPLLPLRRRSLG